MIVFKKNGESSRSYSHIECDAPDCDEMSPPAHVLQKRNLFEHGWHLRGGTHRCPKHVDVDTQPTEPVTRAADGSEGQVR